MNINKIIDKILDDENTTQLSDTDYEFALIALRALKELANKTGDAQVGMSYNYLLQAIQHLFGKSADAANKDARIYIDYDHLLKSAVPMSDIKH